MSGFLVCIILVTCSPPHKECALQERSRIVCGVSVCANGTGCYRLQGKTNDKHVLYFFMGTIQPYYKGIYAFIFSKEKQNPFVQGTSEAREWEFGYSSAEDAYNSGVEAYKSGKSSLDCPDYYDDLRIHIWNGAYYASRPLWFRIVSFPFYLTWLFLVTSYRILWFAYHLGEALMLMFFALVILALLMACIVVIIYSLFTGGIVT